MSELQELAMKAEQHRAAAKASFEAAKACLHTAQQELNKIPHIYELADDRNFADKVHKVRKACG